MSWPTESSLLSILLLSPASLPIVLTVQKFTALFPDSVRSSPQILLFYRDLQHQRALQIDAVRKSTAVEAKQGEYMKQEIIRARRREEREGPGFGMDVEEGGGMEGWVG